MLFWKKILNMVTGAMYDDETIQVLEKISEDAFSGKTKTYTLEESMKKIRTNPKNNGI